MSNRSGGTGVMTSCPAHSSRHSASGPCAPGKRQPMPMTATGSVALAVMSVLPRSAGPGRQVGDGQDGRRDRVAGRAAGQQDVVAGTQLARFEQVVERDDVVTGTDVADRAAVLPG